MLMEVFFSPCTMNEILTVQVGKKIQHPSSKGRNAISSSHPAITRGQIRSFATPSPSPPGNTFPWHKLCQKKYCSRHRKAPVHFLTLSCAKQMQCCKAQSHGNTCRHLWCHCSERRCSALRMHTTETPALRGAAICWRIHELRPHSISHLMWETWFIQHPITPWVNITYTHQYHTLIF